MGEFDVLVGINLLREGLDLPEVSLVSILDADKEGFLRSSTSLIQTIGRAARNVSGQVHMYADKITPSMAQAIDETNRRRAKQVAYNLERGIDPQPLRKRIADITDLIAREDADTEALIGSGRVPQSRQGARCPGSAAAVTPGGTRRSSPACRGPSWRRPDPAAQRPDARGRGRAPVRAGRAPARRDRRAQEGAPRDGCRRRWADVGRAWDTGRRRGVFPNRETSSSRSVRITVPGAPARVAGGGDLRSRSDVPPVPAVRRSRALDVSLTVWAVTWSPS